MQEWWISLSGVQQLLWGLAVFFYLIVFVTNHDRSLWS